MSATAPRPPARQPATASIDEIDAVLPQTQCTRCGYPDCRRYAEAIAAGQAPINRCPPGGHEGIQRLSGLTGQPVLPLDTDCGPEGPRLLAVIDEAWCIGCTLCLDACPVDCITGAHKRMHTVIDALCTGCELCVPVCPVDCISLLPVSVERSGWAAWSQPQADEARSRYQFHQVRLARAETDHQQGLSDQAEAMLADLPAHSQHTDAVVLDRKREVIAAALTRARARQGGGGKP